MYYRLIFRHHAIRLHVVFRILHMLTFFLKMWCRGTTVQRRLKG